MSTFIKTILKNYSFQQAIRAEIEEDIGFFVRGLPGIMGFMVRYLAYKPFFAKIKSMPYIYPGVRFVYMGRISLGRKVLINSNTYIYGKGGIEIGNNVLISPNCSIVAGDHNIDPNLPIIEQSPKAEKIIINSDCWIGSNCVVVGGVSVGKGAIIGAGAVVTKNIEPYSINVGVPAKKIGERKGSKHNN